LVGLAISLNHRRRSCPGGRYQVRRKSAKKKGDAKVEAEDTVSDAIQVKATKRLWAGIQRQPDAECFLAGCAFGALQGLGDFFRWRFLFCKRL
jgi:hypothetical protein